MSPDMLIPRCANPDSPIEFVVIHAGENFVIEISDRQALGIAATMLEALALRRGKVT